MFAFLWKNRERPRLLSQRWFVVWIKRLLRSRDLLGIYRNRNSMERRGARIGSLSIVYGLEVNGKYSNIAVGAHTFISRNVHMAPHAEINVGSFCCINDGVRILTASHDLSDPKWRMFSKEIVVEDYAWIATGAMLLPGARIGRGAVVGAGAVVACDVPAYALATGNPATVKLDRRTRDLDYDPVIFAAPYESWIGRNMELKKEPELK